MFLFLLKLVLFGFMMLVLFLTIIVLLHLHQLLIGLLRVRIMVNRILDHILLVNCLIKLGLCHHLHVVIVHRKLSRGLCILLVTPCLGGDLRDVSPCLR